MKKYSTEELKVIASAMNVLSITSEQTMALLINRYHVSRFDNDTHCIDYTNKNGFMVYKKEKGHKTLSEKILTGKKMFDFWKRKW